MYLCKKIIFCIVVIVVGLSFFSGCILSDLLFGTSFSLTSWEVCDDEGFAGLSLVFSNTGTVTVKIFGYDGSMLDSDYFFYGDHDTVLHLSLYKETVVPGQYRLSVCDKSGNEIFDKAFSFSRPDLSIISCDQKWWKREAWKGGYSLVGLTMRVQNKGDTPVYPYTAEMIVDSKSYSGLVLPSVILPNESKYVDCFVYKEDTPENDTFTVMLKDLLGGTLATGPFSVVLEDNVLVKEFRWSYDGLNRRLSIPYPKFLFDYYNGIDRIRNEDYGIYVFDPYDDDYLDVIVDNFKFDSGIKSDVDKINFAAFFVQNLTYKKDSETNDSFEYPRYPVETLFNGDGGGDCEDKAIFMASILNQMSYDVALFRLPNHMAVGVHLDETAVDYEYYTGNYYFLETTALGKPVGFIPSEHRSSSDLTVYPVSSRPLLIHNWKNNSLTIFTNTELGDLVKATLIVKNLGSETAKNIEVEGAFYTQYDLKLNNESDIISSLKPGMTKEVTLTADIPQGVTTLFKTRVYLDNEVVDEKESAASFP